MKKSILAALICSLFLLGCRSKIYSLKGKYPIQPITFHSNNAPDVVWDHLIDLFAQKGLSIKILDRSSGLIVSEKSLMPYTRENRNGKLIDPGAFIVIPTIISPSSMKPLVPSDATCEWNVRIKAKDGGTDINVNLVNFNVYYIDGGKRRNVEGVTTGVFEQYIIENIK